MSKRTAIIGQRKKIALIAHDHKKPDLLEWVRFNKGTLLKHELFATGTTGKLLEQEIGSGLPRRYIPVRNGLLCIRQDLLPLLRLQVHGEPPAPMAWPRM